MSILSRFKPKKKEKFSIGLDIGTQEIKCVKLKINDTAELVGFEIEESQLDPTEVLKKIKNSQNADLVNISFSGSSTVIRYVNFMRMNKQELRQALKFEAQKHIPFSLSEVNLDAEILKNDLPDNKMLVLIAALKKELMQQRMKILENCGLRANCADIDSLALVNCFNYNYPKVETLENKSICLLNIGATISNVNILDNGIPRLSRDIHVAGTNFTKKFMDIFELEFKAAEELKISRDPEKAEKAKAGIENVLTSLAGEVRTSFDYYESQHTSSVAKIFLSGGASMTEGLVELLPGLLGIPVETWDPFKQIKISEQVDAQKLTKNANKFNVAVGLALRE